MGNVFSHHQKCVLVDTKANENRRKITAFIGGLDLCDGRYDTPKHTLFNGLDTIYSNDFHNPTCPVSTISYFLGYFLHSQYSSGTCYLLILVCTKSNEDRRIF